jgi:hypothetical protein
LANTVSFETDIRPLFRPIDIDHMKPGGFDLGSYAGVKARATEIYDAVIGKRMPPSPDIAWTEAMCATLKSWIDEGFPP